MSRGKRGFFTFVTALATLAAAAVAPASAVTTSGTVAASDEKAPEPVTNIAAFPGGGGVELSWDLSVSDAVRQSPTVSDFTSSGTFTNVNDVAGYNIWRNEDLIDSVPAGETMYVDALAAGANLTYNVTAYDAAGNESVLGEPAIVSLGPPPTAIVPGADIVFGDFATDESAIETVAIQNAATDSGAVLLFTTALRDGSQGFSVAPSSAQIDTGASMDVEITFSAADVGNINGSYSDTVRVRTNDPNNSTVLIAVFANITGGSTEQTISLNSTALNFSSRQVINTTATKSIVITNSGGLPLIGTVSLAGDAVFTTTASGDLSLAAGESQTVAVEYGPIAVGTFTGSLTIESNDTNRPTVTVPISGGAVATPTGPSVIVTIVYKARLSFPIRPPGISLTDPSEPFRETIRQSIANRTGVSLARVIIRALTEGSLIVDFEVTKTGGTTGEPTAAAAIAALETAVADTTTDPFPELTADLGTVQALSDLSEAVTLLPEDPGGNPVLGWFTRQEDQVGLADFFSFADHYGSSSTEADYQDVFDIAPDTPDGIVELSDFFVFADNYGKTIANADEIRAALQ